MTAIAHACISIACNVCSAPLIDEDDGGIPHFTTTMAAARSGYAYDYGWIIAADGFALCTDDDQAHLDAVAGMLPTFTPPPLDGQLELPLDNHEGEVTA